jgi:PncC family amidohydrolase
VSAAEPAEDDTAAVVHRLLVGEAATVATAESLTGGLLGAALTCVPGASTSYRGGVVAYATELKTTLLGVDPEVLAARGAVDPGVAAAMAGGARTRCAATYGVATTGVAGPDPQDGKPVGLVYVAVSGPRGVEVVEQRLAGDRAAIRGEAVRAALRLLRKTLEGRDGR